LATSWRLPFLLGLGLVPSACQNVPPAEPAAPRASQDGRAYAETTCAPCHAIGRSGASPNPNAPPFRTIVNREGASAETLSAVLRGPHNVPRAMDFWLSEREVDAIITYMLTLREPAGRRRPD
jgi:mono/diheme cytochrome c family protein